MPVIQAKRRRAQSLGYNSWIVLPFDTAALSASEVATTVVSRIPLLLNVKIIGVSVVVSGTVAGTASLNINLGTTTPNPIVTGTPDQTQVGVAPANVAAAGSSVFAANQAITMTADAVTNLYTANSGTNLFDVIWPAGGELTLRLVTNGSATGNLKVLVWAVPVDINPGTPEQDANRFIPNASQL